MLLDLEAEHVPFCKNACGLPWVSRVGQRQGPRKLIVKVYTARWRIPPAQKSECSQWREVERVQRSNDFIALAFLKCNMFILG